MRSLPSEISQDITQATVKASGQAPRAFGEHSSFSCSKQVPEVIYAAVDASLKRVIAALDTVAETSLLWKTGFLKDGGPHRRLKGKRFPISIGEDECLVFGKLIQEFRPEHCYIIGNAFGLSSTYIADVMQRHGGKSVTTLDDQSEGEGKRVASIAQRLTDALELNAILKNRKGASPGDIPKTAERDVYDLIFVDGLHRHPQVTLDFEGMLPYSDANSLFVFHDSWAPGIPEAAQRAKEEGFRCLWIPTSCEMIVATRNNAHFERLQALFDNAIEDQKRRPSVGLGLLLFCEYIAFYWNLYWNRLLGR